MQYKLSAKIILSKGGINFGSLLYVSSDSTYYCCNDRGDVFRFRNGRFYSIQGKKHLEALQKVLDLAKPIRDELAYYPSNGVYRKERGLVCCMQGYDYLRRRGFVRDVDKKVEKKDMAFAMRNYGWLTTAGLKGRLS